MKGTSAQILDALQPLTGGRIDWQRKCTHIRPNVYYLQEAMHPYNLACMATASGDISSTFGQWARFSVRTRIILPILRAAYSFVPSAAIICASPSEVQGCYKWLGKDELIAA